MAFVFHRRLAIPLWMMALFAVAVTAPPPAPLALAAVLVIAAIAVTTPGLVAWLRGCVPLRLDESTSHTDQDALDLVRMDDDGGWQMARPPA
jgi:hypothetical protein